MKQVHAGCSPLTGKEKSRAHAILSLSHYYIKIFTTTLPPYRQKRHGRFTLAALASGLHEIYGMTFVVTIWAKKKKVPAEMKKKTCSTGIHQAKGTTDDYGSPPISLRKLIVNVCQLPPPGNATSQRKNSVVAAKVRGDCDRESIGNPARSSSHDHPTKKQKKEDSAPADISQSASENPIQVRLKEYPRHSEGKSHARSFVGAWFDKYEWAEYSKERDAMFCFACRHFAPPTYGNADEAFIKSGFRRWKKAHGKDGAIEKHISSQCHKTSCIAWADYQRNKADKTSIAQCISEAYQKKVRENRHYIKTLGEIILLTVTQDISQRGHREGDDELNPGNVRKILRFTAKRDPIIADRVESGPKNEKYTCSAIQNEMIDTLACMVKEEIAENLGHVITFLFKLMKPRMLMDLLDAASITDIILKSLDKLGLDYKSSLVGLGFDGASVMSGGISGVQKRIRDKAPFAYYIHCYGHRLNLVLINVAKYVPQAAEFFSLLEELYIFASNSVVHEKFILIQREMLPEEQVRELQHLSDTRWWCQATSCENALLRLECIMRLLKEISEDDIGARAVSARGLLAQIDAEFVYLLQFFTDILGKVNKVSTQLQDKQADLGKAANLISSLHEHLVNVRNSDLNDHYSEKVNELCRKCCITPTTTRKRVKKPRKLDGFIVFETSGQGSSVPCHVQHIRIFYEVLDCLISELDRRFSKESNAIFCGISALCPGGQTFLLEEDLKAYAMAYSISGTQHMSVMDPWSGTTVYVPRAVTSLY
ncbi:zinc finger MYM-type protein 1-like [Macrobrachium rosenbergii]|uniref:zinc finger MYM-type protein 1-like n=1 Tax=Macrobrachium rosenbergii TaxID=79674 RepID=UPI0034D4DF54